VSLECLELQNKGKLRLSCAAKGLVDETAQR